MVARVAGLGRSFAGVAAYCLHDAREPGRGQPETSERVEWTDTRNLPTSRGDRAAAVMAATAEAAPDIKRLAGGSAAGRKLAKPVCHYSLNWARDEEPGREEMSRAVDESLKALGLEKHQTLIVAHNDKAHRHVHVIVNRVDVETGKAAHVGRSKLLLSKWAEEYEGRQGRIRCEERVTNNARRARGRRLHDRGSLPTGRYRRERLNPHREPRKTILAGHDWDVREKVAWQRAEEAARWGQLHQRRVEALRDLDLRSRSEWTELYDRQREQQRWLETDWRRGIRGRFRLWRAAGEWREFAGVMRGRPEMLRRWRGEMEQGHRYQRVQLAKAHFEDVRAIEVEVGEGYRSGLEGSEERAELAARTNGRSFELRYDEVEDWRVRAHVDGARLDQVREVDGEAAYRERLRVREELKQLRERGPQTPRPQQPRQPDRGLDRGGGFER